MRKPPVTLRDVAEAADVHISTVSRALDPAKFSLVSASTRAKVTAIAEDLGYRPHLIASQLRRGQTQTVGVVVPDLGNPLYAPFVRGVTHALDRNGYMPLVADTQDDSSRFRRILQHLWNRRVDALITTAPRSRDRRALADIVAQGLPVILAVRTLPGSGFPSVQHDDEGGGRLAAEHLIGLGHRRLIQLQGPPDVAPFAQRSRGFTAAAQEAGIELVDLGITAAHPTLEEGRRLMEIVLAEANPLPTGVFAQNDLFALGALEALRNAGLWCPDDISLVGYNDNFFAAHARPSLTTIRLPGYDIGRLAGRMAIEYIVDPKGTHASESAPPTLLVRESTGPPPSH